MLKLNKKEIRKTRKEEMDLNTSYVEVKRIENFINGGYGKI